MAEDFRELEHTTQARGPLFKWLNVAGVAGTGAAIAALFKGWQP